MSNNPMVRRLTALSTVMARRMPIVLAATIALLESVLEVAKVDVRVERMPTAPVVLTAEQVLEAARARGVPAFGRAAGERLILLASLGLDLSVPGVRAALVEMHHRAELRLVHLGNPGASRVDLDARGLRFELVDESLISDGFTTFHTVVLS